jgi:small subunit ribosomal protein S4
MTKDKCKTCRAAGEKLFLKGEKCMTAKCPMVRRPYSPGFQGKKRRRYISDYAKELLEKQKLKIWYNLKEKQFKKYVKQVLEKRGQVEDAQSLLIEKLETRLDNVVYRLGFASSRAQARQMVNHGHLLINGKKVNIPSFQLRKGDKISFRDSSKKKPFFGQIQANLKNHRPPSWLKLDLKKMEAEVVSSPSFDEAMPPVEISTVFEFYSR